MTQSLPILYSFRRCPYAMRARMALTVSRQTCALREVVLRSKPPEMLHASAKGTVPILIFPDGTVLDESFAIMEWALETSDPEKWLEPETGTRDEMNDLIAKADDDFKHHLDRYKYPNRYENADPHHHRLQGVTFLDHLDAQLRHRPFLFGGQPALADIAIVPFVRQFANTDRDWFDKIPFQSLHNWLNTLLDSNLFRSIMKKYPVWSSGDLEPLFPEPIIQKKK